MCVSKLVRSSLDGANFEDTMQYSLISRYFDDFLHSQLEYSFCFEFEVRTCVEVVLRSFWRRVAEFGGPRGKRPVPEFHFKFASS